MPKGYPDHIDIPDETLEDRMEKLAELKAEYRSNKKEFERKNEHLLETIKSLENIITAEVLELGKTVTVGNLRAEFIPTVRIRLKKVNDEQQ